MTINFDALQRHRKVHRIETDDQLAKKVGVSKATVSRVLAGQRLPTNQFIAGILRTFDAVHFHELFNLADKPNYHP